MELNEETVKKSLDWLDSLVGNSNDSDMALLTYQLLGILYDTCEELTEEVEWRKNQYLSLVESHNRTCDYLNTKEVEMAKLTEENERLRAQNERYAELEEGCYVTGYKNIKADTVREMQERLNEVVENSGNRVYTGSHIHLFLDKIAKEMLEGSNG